MSRRRGSHRLVEVVARVARSKGAVIFLPSIGWNVKLFQRPHHLARAFARSGYVAIFASTSTGDDIYGFEEIEPNLFLFCGPASWLRRIPNPYAGRTFVNVRVLEPDVVSAFPDSEAVNQALRVYPT